MTLTTCAALLPARAEAAALVEGRVGAFRERWAAHRQDTLDSLFLERPGADPESLRAGCAIGDGLGALSTFKDLELVPVEDQAHPAMQGLLRDAARAMGGMIVACRERVEAFLAGVGEAPDRETHLRAALRSVRLGLGDWRTTVGRQRGLELALLEMEEDPGQGALVRRAERLVRRIRKLELVAAGLAADSDRTGLLEVSDPEVHARAAAGRARWAVDGPGGEVSLDADGGDEARTRLPWIDHLRMILGVLAIGLGAAGGTILALAGVCSIGCGGGAGAVALLLLGVAVAGLSVWGGVVLFRAGNRRRREDRARREAEGREPSADGLPEREEALPEDASPAADDEPLGAGPRRVLTDDFVPVLAAELWVATPARRESGRVVLVEATGLVRSPGAWMADADGSRVAPDRAALVPGAPIGALVGRVGGDRFFLGRGGVVPEGPEGVVELAVNRHVDGERCLGHFAARVRVFGPGGGGG